MGTSNLLTTPDRAKPYPEFPLFRHNNGQWCKKVKGRLEYFGTDADTALKEWVDNKELLLAGRKRRSKQEGATVRDGVNRFLTAKKDARDCGELSARMFGEYYTVAQTVIETFGATRLIEDLAGDDFEELRKHFNGLAAVTVGKRVQIVRTLFRYAFDEEIIQRPVRFGASFKKPSKKNLRKAKSARGNMMIEADDLQRVIKVSRHPMKAMILLALNAGLGNTDLGNLPQSAIDLDRGWLDYPRPKTGVGRTCPLWPETVAAIREAIIERPDAKQPEHDGLVFLTRLGQPWVRVTPRDEGNAILADAITLEFSKLLKTTGLKAPGKSFYALRHVFRTIADGAKDQPAIDHIMGHSDGSMDEAYRERIDDDRLVAVSNVVHNWLFKKDESKAKGKRQARYPSTSLGGMSEPSAFENSVFG